MTVQVSHYRRGKYLKTIHTDLKPGYSREVPNWMFDPSFCAGMTQGPPEVCPILQSPVGRNTKGLVEALADLLLEAMGLPSSAIPMVKGGGDEQDHA